MKKLSAFVFALPLTLALTLGLGMSATSSSALAASAPEIPVEDFFRNAEIRGLQMSPDGKSIAAIVPVNKRLNLAVLDIASNKLVSITGLKEQNITSYNWANNNRIMFSYDTDGNESNGLFGINKDEIGRAHV